MKLVNQEDILASLENDGKTGLQIEHGEKDRVTNAGYNPCWQGVFSFSKGKLDVDNLTISPGETIVFTTRERFNVPEDMHGLSVNRVLNAVQQLNIDTTFVDPGYHGKLRVTITNIGVTEYPIEPDYKLCKLVLFQQESPQPGIRKAKDRDEIDLILQQINSRIKDQERQVEAKINAEKRAAREGAIRKLYKMSFTTIILAAILCAILYASVEDKTILVALIAIVVSGTLSITIAPFMSAYYQSLEFKELTGRRGVK